MIYDCTSLKCLPIFRSFAKVAKHIYHIELGPCCASISKYISLKMLPCVCFIRLGGRQRCLEGEKEAMEQKSLRNTGLNYTVLDKITPPRKRISEPHEIQISCYRRGPEQQRHSGSSTWFIRLSKTVRHLHHWNFNLLSFWLGLSLLCDVNYETENEKFSL